MNNIDVPGVDLRFDDQPVTARHDIEQGLARSDDAARGVDLKADDDAVLRCPNVRAPEHVLGGTDALANIEEFVLHRAQLFDHLVDHRRPQFVHAQPVFADVLARPGDAGVVVAAAALDLGLAALQCAQAWQPGQSLLDQTTDVLDLVNDELQLAVLRGDLRLEAGDLLLELGDALVEDADLATDRSPTRLEDFGLSNDRFHHLRIVGAVGQGCREPNDILAIAFGDQPSFERQGGELAAAKEFQRRPRPGFIQPDQNLSGTDPIPLGDQDLADDSALQVLDGLAFGIDPDDAGGD